MGGRRTPTYTFEILATVAEQVALVVEDVAARATVNGTGAVRGVGGHGVLLSDTTFITHDASQTRTLARSDVQLLQRLREPLLGVRVGGVPVVDHDVGGTPKALGDHTTAR